MRVEIANKTQLSQAIQTWPVTAATAIFFGGERFYWASWGAIAYSDSRLVLGIATVGEEGEGTGEPTIIGLMVAPTSRRQGIGTALLAAVIEEARQRSLLPLRYDALTPSGLALAQAGSYDPEVLALHDQNLGLEIE